MRMRKSRKQKKNMGKEKEVIKIEGVK